MFLRQVAYGSATLGLADFVLVGAVVAAVVVDVVGGDDGGGDAFLGFPMGEWLPIVLVGG